MFIDTKKNNNMVFGVPFQCDICNTVMSIKIQADNSLYSYDYPISVKCPKCGNTNQDKMNVARRTCGRNYIATI